MMSQDRYRKQSQSLVGYFERNTEQQPGAYALELDVARRWQQLVERGNATPAEVSSLLAATHSDPTNNGSGWIELCYAIQAWAAGR